jgi:hypothetical protein
MKIQFTVNVTEVRDGDGETIATDEEHYELALRTFISQNQGTEHELLCDTGEAIYFEMEDIEAVKEDA